MRRRKSVAHRLPATANIARKRLGPLTKHLLPRLPLGKLFQLHPFPLRCDGHRRLDRETPSFCFQDQEGAEKNITGFFSFSSHCRWFWWGKFPQYPRFRCCRRRSTHRPGFVPTASWAMGLSYFWIHCRTGYHGIVCRVPVRSQNSCTGIGNLVAPDPKHCSSTSSSLPDPYFPAPNQGARHSLSHISARPLLELSKIDSALANSVLPCKVSSCMDLHTCADDETVPAFDLDLGLALGELGRPSGNGDALLVHVLLGMWGSLRGSPHSWLGRREQ